MEGREPLGEDPGPPEMDYRDLVEHVPAITYSQPVGPGARTHFVSPQVERILGYSPEDYRSTPGMWARLLHPDDRERMLRASDRTNAESGPWRHEYRMVAHDGHVVWFRDEATLVYGRDGEPIYRQGIMLDISDHGRLQGAFDRSDSRYLALVEQIPAIVYVSAPDDYSRTLYINPQIVEMLGYGVDEWLGQPDMWPEVLHPDDREVVLAANDRHNESGEPWSYEYRMIANDGRAVWVRDEAVLIRDDTGLPLYWQGLVLDITDRKLVEEALQDARDELELRVMQRTQELAEANEMMALEIGERKRVEAELREAEEKYRLLVERAPGVLYLWDTDPDAKPTLGYVSPNIESLLGYPSASWCVDPNAWMRSVHPDDRARVREGSARSKRTGEPFGMLYRMISRNGDPVWVRDEAVVIATGERGPRLFVGMLVDVTERMRVEAELREAEAKYRSLVEQLPAITYIQKAEPAADGRVSLSYVSPQVESILGYTPEELITEPEHFVRTLHPDDRTRVLAEEARTNASGEPFTAEYRVFARDGRIVWIHSEAVLVRDDAGRPKFWHGVALDITAQKNAEEAQRQAEEALREIELRFRELTASLGNAPLAPPPTVPEGSAGAG